jgi:hypothetical protein
MATKKRVLAIVLPAASLLLVLLLTLWDLQHARHGPGPLSQAHRAATGLADGQRCEACHAPGQGIDAARCGACHAAIAGQLAADPAAKGLGLHASLPHGQRERCEACHSEHHGDLVALIAPHAFARAGVADPEHYDHAHVDFGLGGRHRTLACASCHANADNEQPPTGGRFLGLTQACTSCHDDAHRGAFGSNCAECHGQEQPFGEAAHFVHGALPLTGAHGRVGCSTCHAADSVRSVAAARAANPDALPPRACRDCHADPHAAGTSLPFADTADCRRCHDATAWTSARPDAAAHAALGFPLLGPHAHADCRACHQNGTASRPRAVNACAACHDSPHHEPFVADRTCADCHRADDALFSIGERTRERAPASWHAATGMPLTAPHDAVACARCHLGASYAERYLDRTADDCRRCHGDVHGGQFDRTLRRARACTDCHAKSHFVPTAFDRRAHAKTRFPLDGAHDAVGCHRCHEPASDGVRRFVGTPTTCAACHHDPHAGRFDRSGLPAAVDGRTGCTRCHDVRSFADAARTFEHGTWTGWPLEGAHREAACAACHGASTTGSGLGAVAGRRCADCHAEPHAGQFADAATATTDCARCHDPAAWRIERFDHATTRFPLDDVHGRVGCARCHPGHGNEGAFVRYRPLGTACGDCHRPGGGR